MNVVIVCGGTLGEALDIIRKAFIDAMWIDELNELLSDCRMYEEEVEFKERISFHCLPIKVMKSQVLDCKPKCIRARTVC